jgi:superoxide dismutase, Cu-Zn family
MKPITTTATAGLALAVYLTAAAVAQAGSAELRNAEGDVVANVSLAEEDGKLRVTVTARDLPPGFHGFHIHAVGACEPPDFSSAEGHLNPEGEDHADHAGDLPNLLVMEDGSAEMSVLTDRATMDDLLADDGAAFIIHADPDNHAHIPERYADEPDEETLETGDAGDRLACGVVTE